MAYKSIISENELSLDEAFNFVNDPEFGGNCLFVGTVRRTTGKQITEALEFESFEAMARKEMDVICQHIITHFGPAHCYISHRTGCTLPGTVVVIIAVSTAHRKKAFEACEYAIDTLKKTVPIWKKEILEDGSYWVNAHP